MPAVVESPVSNFVHLLHAAVFTIDGGKDTIMPLALANEHKREHAGAPLVLRQACRARALTSLKMSVGA